MRTFIAALLLFSASTAAAASKDEDAIKGRVAEFVALFNKGDAKAMSAYLTDDAVLVNPVGTKGTGRAEIEAIFKHDSDAILKGATMDMKVVEFRATGKDAAWVELEHSVKGARTPDGKTMDLLFHVPCLFVKKGKTWLLAEARPYAFLPAPTPPPATAVK
jgi:uncharacterized protein (TIGR02246 family)